jgi:hypothetical protein
MDENELRRLAEEARRELAELILDEHERARIDSDLAGALNEPPGNAKPALMEALRSHEAIRRWVAADTDRFVSQQGDVMSPVGVLYMCPEKNYAIVLEMPPDEVLLCPKDGSVLERYEG